MKLWRCLLLMLLAVMIPARGAVAAAMMCPQHRSVPMEAQHQPAAGPHEQHAHHAKAHEPSPSMARASSHTHHHAGEPAHASGPGLGQHPSHHPHELGDLRGDHRNGHDSQHGGGNSNPSSACQLCASVCSMTPMLGTLPTWQPPAATPSADFPPLRVPAPSFQSDGPERPPRRT